MNVRNLNGSRCVDGFDMCSGDHRRSSLLSVNCLCCNDLWLVVNVTVHLRKQSQVDSNTLVIIANNRLSIVQ